MTKLCTLLKKTLGRLNPRQWYLAVSIVSAALIAYALYLQFYQALEPCPLCILQRYAFVGVAVFAGLAAAVPLASIHRMLASVGVLFALAGAGIAAWHIKLQWFPPEISACGPGLAYMITELPLARALPRIFQGGGDCTEVGWQFLGLSIPAWAFIWLVLLAIGLVVGLRRSFHVR